MFILGQERISYAEISVSLLKVRSRSEEDWSTNQIILILLTFFTYQKDTNILCFIDYHYANFKLWIFFNTLICALEKGMANHFSILAWEPHEQYDKAKRYDTERWTPQVSRYSVCYWRRMELVESTCVNSGYTTNHSHKESTVLSQRQKYRSVEQNRKPRDNPCTYRHLIFDKGGKNIQWNKDNIFNKWGWENWSTTCKRMKLEHFLTPRTKIS